MTVSGSFLPLNTSNLHMSDGTITFHSLAGSEHADADVTVLELSARSISRRNGTTSPVCTEIGLSDNAQAGAAIVGDHWILH